jgi:hypothetical protein
VAADEVYRQCLLRTAEGSKEDVAWIPAEYAQRGRTVVITLEHREPVRWVIVETYGTKKHSVLNQEESTRRRLEDKLDG